jgi:hypothetical protein
VTRRLKLPRPIIAGLCIRATALVRAPALVIGSALKRRFGTFVAMSTSDPKHTSAIATGCSMSVCVMHIRHVRMPVTQPQMLVLMCVRLARRINRAVIVLMVIVVQMRV